ncbi:hypothetical protein STA3757_16270 [Stanieria sp. NIES-3757]|nr:hypothetical protein STA3757_16270 [Stanieria sp. NIES-3757]
MNQGIVILQRQNLKIHETFVSESNNRILTFIYQDKTYEKLSISFKLSLKGNALEFCKNYLNKHQKQCILVDEKEIFSVWSEILSTSAIKESGLSKSQTPILSSAEKKEKVTSISTSFFQNLSVTQATLLIIQILLDDIEDLMGNRHQESFKQELIKILQKSHLPGTESLEKINVLLTIDPRDNNQLPSWQQEQVNQMFAYLTVLAKKYFNNTSFVDSLMEVLQELPEYSKFEFVNCCTQFVLLCRA